jgi:hypothetical protein
MSRPWTTTILAAFVAAFVPNITSAYAAEVSGLVPPPAQYDHEPNMPVVEHILSFEEVTAICGQRWGRDRTYLGCASVLGGKCIIYRVDDARVLRHERGHCSGWPSDHSMAVATKPVSYPWQKEVVVVKPWPTNAPDAGPLTLRGEASPKRDLIADAIRGAGATR